MSYNSSWIKVLAILIILSPKTLSQLETTVPAPTKKTPAELQPTCDSPVDMMFPTDTACYVGEKVILLTNDNLKGKLVKVLWFLDSLIQTKYDEYRNIYLVGEEESTGKIIKSFICPKYGKQFTLPTGTCIRNKTLDHYKKLLTGKSFFPLRQELFSKVFLAVQKQVKDPFTGELFTLKRNEPLEYVKMTILDSVKSYPEIVAIFRIGNRHVALFFSEFYPNSFFSEGIESFFLDKKDSDRLKKKFGQNMWQTMMEGKIQIGMSDEMVRIAWGLPGKINKSASALGSEEQWVYGEQFVYFRNGICTGWN